jgi:hypothetical protein
LPLWLVVLLLIAWLLPATGLAQGVESSAATIQRLNVQVMPEFDDARVLVVVQGRLPDSASLPQSLTFRLPRGAQVNQMAVINVSDGRPAARAYEMTDDPADARWSLATYTIDGAHFFFEYYFNPLGASPEKAFTFTFSPRQAVGELVLEVQQPRAARAFSTNPPAAGERVDSYGLTFFQLPVGVLEVGEETAVAVRYTKTDPNPSVPRHATMKAAAVPDAKDSIPLWAYGVLAAVIAGSMAVFSLLRARQPKPEPISAPIVSYCPQCGVRQRDHSRFCHTCGAAL